MIRWDGIIIWAQDYRITGHHPGDTKRDAFFVVFFGSPNEKNDSNFLPLHVGRGFSRIKGVVIV